VIPALGALLALVAVSCGTTTSTKGARAEPTTWTVSVPTVVAHTLNEALAIIGSDPAVGPRSLDVGVLSASVFALGDDHPDTTNKEWQDMATSLCGPDGLVDEALAGGWDVTFTGYVDSSGPTGPGTLNDRLLETRATAAASELGQTCKIPADRIKTAKGGIGGDGAAGRKVTVAYTRSPQTGSRP